MVLKKDGLIRVRESTANLESRLSNVILELESELKSFDKDMNIIKENRKSISELLDQYEQKTQELGKEITSYKDDIHKMKTQKANGHFRQSVLENELQIVKRFNNELQKENDELKEKSKQSQVSSMSLNKLVKLNKIAEINQSEVESLRNECIDKNTELNKKNEENKLLKLMVEHLFDGKYHLLILTEILKNQEFKISLKEFLEIQEISDLESGLVKRAVMELKGRKIIDYDSVNEKVELCEDLKLGFRGNQNSE